jgi:hypothetical protein
MFDPKWFCRNCAYWDRIAEHQDQTSEQISSFCIRYPPTRHPPPEHRFQPSRYPIVSENGQCGEFKLRSELAPDAGVAITVAFSSHPRIKNLLELLPHEPIVLAQLAKYSASDLLEIRGFGPHLLEVVERVLAEHGLTLAKD